MTLRCDCEGWKKSAHQIFAAQIFLKLTKEWKYTGDVFKFCPWCGKKLEAEVNDEKRIPGNDEKRIPGNRTETRLWEGS